MGLKFGSDTDHMGAKKTEVAFFFEIWPISKMAGIFSRKSANFGDFGPFRG